MAQGIVFLVAAPCSVIPGDQKFSVHLMITIHISDAQRIFDHPVNFFFHVPDGRVASIFRVTEFRSGSTVI